MVGQPIAPFFEVEDRMVDVENMFRIGVITSPHGVQGEVNVYPTTDDVRRYDKLKTVWMVDKREKKLCHVQRVKYFKNMVILKLEEIPDRNAAELMRQKELYVDRQDAIPLEEGEYYVADLIGLTVKEEDGTVLGELSDVLQTGANDVYEVKRPQGKDVLIPVIPLCVKKVDLEAGTVTVHLLPGMLED